MDLIREADTLKKYLDQLESRRWLLEDKILEISELTLINERFLSEISPNQLSLAITSRDLNKKEYAEVLNRLPNLELFDLYNCSPLAALESFEEKNLYLKFLSIEHTPLTDRDLFLISEKFPHLEQLILWSFGSTTLSGFQYLVDGLSRLVSLKVDHCDVSTLQIKTLAERCPCLQSLHIEHADTLRRENDIPFFHFLCEKYPHLDIQFH